MAQRKAGRTVVAEPLTPTLLARLGALDSLPETPPDFDPARSWVNKYLIFTCHGYVESGNQGIGVLRLEREPEERGAGFLFRVRQRIVHDTGHVHEIEVLARCHADRLATPIEWRLLSRIEDPGGRELRGLQSEDRGSFDAGKIVVKRGSAERVRPWKGPLTSDWGLMEAVQRLDPGADNSGLFSLLQGFAVMRSGQEIVAVRQERVGEVVGGPLLRVTQIGRGVLPYDYWLLPGPRRLAILTTGARAYILDERADEAVNRRLRAIRARNRRRRHD